MSEVSSPGRSLPSPQGRRRLNRVYRAERHARVKGRQRFREARRRIPKRLQWLWPSAFPCPLFRVSSASEVAVDAGLPESTGTGAGSVGLRAPRSRATSRRCSWARTRTRCRRSNSPCPSRTYCRHLGIDHHTSVDRREQPGFQEADTRGRKVGEHDVVAIVPSSRNFTQRLSTVSIESHTAHFRENLSHGVVRPRM